MDSQAAARGNGLGMALLGALVICLVCATQAQAATFTVNSNAGDSDAGINGDCDTDPTPDDDCTLVAAIEEANATAAADIINFSKVDSGADPDDTAFIAGKPVLEVSVAGVIPTITKGVTIGAGNCSTDPFGTSPCAKVGTGWVVNSAGDVAIDGLAFSGSGTAIDVSAVTGGSPSVPDFRLTNTWFGIDTLGGKATTTPPVTAVLLEDVDGAEIGNGSFGRNIFARQGTGVDILGADNTVIENNSFGVLPDGSFARAGDGNAANGDNIEVTGDSAPNPDDPATGTRIGASASLGGDCFGTCNLIQSAGEADSGFGISGGAGVELRADGAGEIPAQGVQIVGNHIGVDNQDGLSSNLDDPNRTGIAVGNADDVVIGGPAAAAADRNILGANPITSASGASGLLIQDNFVMANPSSDSLDLQGSGEVLGNYLGSGTPHTAISLANTSAPNFVVQGNVIGEDPAGNAIGVGGGIGLGAAAAGNTIGGAGASEGNLIAGQTAANPRATPGAGIGILGDGNDVLGNRIGVGSDGSARRLLVGITLGTDADANTIGGSTSAGENLISNMSGDAIRITGADSDGNALLRNRGSANGGLFIDLGDDGVGNLIEPNGPNSGAQAPTISSASPTTATGGAAPGAVVSVFTKSNATAGELEGFLAQTTAAASGAWLATFPAQPDGRLLAATSTIATDTSELSATAAVDATAPQTQIDSGPEEGSATASLTPGFTFSATEAGSSFECRIDGGSFAACSGPGASHTPPLLSDGQHTFEVRATDPAGNTDASPAGRTFTVDATPPDTQINSGPATGSTTVDSTPSFDFSATEAGSAFECRLDGEAFAVCSSEHTTAALGNGQHTFEVRATDPVGNVDPSPATRTFTVDADPPETRIDRQPKDKLKVKKTATVTYEFSSDEPGSTFRCKIDGKPEAPCSSPLKLKKLKKGKHSFEVTAVDAAGNADPTPATDTFKVKRKRRRR